MTAPVPFVAVSQTYGSIFPTTTPRAAGQSTVGMDELVARIRFPVGWFPSAGHDHARAVGGLAALHFHGRSQMHQDGYRTEHTLRVMDQTHQFTQVRLSAQVNDPIQFGMVVPRLPDLDELNPATKMIDDLLITLRLPPLDGNVMFPTGGDNPEGRVLARDFVNLGVPGFFLIREVEVTLERGRLDPEVQTVIEELNKTVKAVVGRFVAPVNQRIATIDLLCLRIIVRQRRNVWIVPPQIGAGRTHVRHKLARIRVMQVANRRRQHYDVAGRQAALENQLPHRQTGDKLSDPATEGTIPLSSRQR